MMNQNQPEKNDAVLGGGYNPLAVAVVLGGIEGVKQRLAAGDTSALDDAFSYGDAGCTLIRAFFTHPDHSQFFIDMKQVDRPVRWSEKRFFWSGPCIDCSRKDFLDVVRATQVDLIWDEEGKHGLTIYPSAYSPESIRAGLKALQLETNNESLDTAIALHFAKGDPLKQIAQNFIAQVWGVDL